MAKILQYGDDTVSGNNSQSSQKMAPLHSTDLLFPGRQLLPAAFRAAHKDLIGSSSAKTRAGTEMAFPAAEFPARRLCSGRSGRPASLDLRRCGAHVGHPESGQRLAKPTAAPSTRPRDTSLPLAAPRRRAVSGRPCSQRAALRRFPKHLPSQCTPSRPHPQQLGTSGPRRHEQQAPAVSSE